MARDEKPIDAEDLEAAEKLLRLRGEIGGMVAVHDRANVDSHSVARWVEHHVRGTLVKVVPDLDPRLEPAINTLMAHGLMVGIVAERRRLRGNG